MKKKILFFSILIIFLSYIFYNCSKNFPSSLPTQNIGYINKTCKIIKSNFPYEDLYQLNENLMIATTYYSNFFDYLYGKKLPKGKIFALNLKEEILFEIPMKNFPDNLTFDPLAIDILNKEYLFCINHRTTEKFSNEQIEIFKISYTGEKGIELTYFKSIVLPNNFFGTLNAIAVKDLETFYFTTWRAFSCPNSPKEIESFFGKIMFKIKNMFLLVQLIFDFKFTYVYIYHKGSLKKIKNSNSILNNGLIYDNKNRLLYGVRSIEKDIKVYKISEKGDDAELLKTIKIPYIADNIFLKDGTLNLGINPYMLDNYKVKDEVKKGNDAKNITHFSGFLEINLKNDEITDILLQDTFKAVSSAIKVDKKIIMSSIAFNGLYICQ